MPILIQQVVVLEKAWDLKETVYNWSPLEGLSVYENITHLPSNYKGIHTHTCTPSALTHTSRVFCDLRGMCAGEAPWIGKGIVTVIKNKKVNIVQRLGLSTAPRQR
jgi:hypothetical protein